MLPNWLYGKSLRKLQEILNSGGQTAAGVSYSNTESGLEATNAQAAIDEIVEKSTITTLSVIKNDSIVGSNFVIKARKQYNAVYITGYFNTSVSANRGDLLFTISGLTFLDANDHFYVTMISPNGAISFAEVYSDGTVKVAKDGGMASGYYIATAVLLVE